MLILVPIRSAAVSERQENERKPARDWKLGQGGTPKVINICLAWAILWVNDGRLDPETLLIVDPFEWDSLGNSTLLGYQNDGSLFLRLVLLRFEWVSLGAQTEIDKYTSSCSCLPSSPTRQRTVDSGLLPLVDLFGSRRRRRRRRQGHPDRVSRCDVSWPTFRKKKKFVSWMVLFYFISLFVWNHSPLIWANDDGDGWLCGMLRWARRRTPKATWWALKGTQ